MFLFGSDLGLEFREGKNQSEWKEMDLCCLPQHLQLPPQSPPRERGGVLGEEELELIHLAIPTRLPANAQPTLSVLLAALDDF